LGDRLRRATAGDYEIRGEIGRGGMAAVYLAYDLLLNRRVAIKVMLPQLSASPVMRERFREEARTAARLDHPNIVTIHAVREADDLPLLVMRYIEGRSLADVLNVWGALDVPVARLVLSQVARALAYAHEEGVVHRDVKPANVMLDRRGSAIVTDFGIAKAAESPHLTQTGAAVGTPAYMSPEQCLGRLATAASDQYSLGVVAYEVLGGTVPFGGSSLEVQWAHAREGPRSLQSLRPDCPPALAAVVMRMLEKDPAKRWPSLTDVAAALADGLTAADEASARLRLAEFVRAGTRSDVEGGVTPMSPVPLSAAAAPPSRPAVPPAATARTVAEPVLEVGESLNLEAAMSDADGRTVATSAAVRWRSSQPAVATVDDAGTVRALAPGRTTLTASVQGTDTSVRLTVVSPAREAGGSAPVPTGVTSVQISEPPAALAVGQTFRLRATPRDAEGAVLARWVEWRSSDEGIASVTPRGVVTARAAGRATITAVADGVDGSVPLTIGAGTTGTSATHVPAGVVHAPRRRGVLLAAGGVLAAAAVILAVANSRTERQGGGAVSRPPLGGDSLGEAAAPPRSPAADSAVSVSISGAPTPVVVGDSFTLGARVRSAGGEMLAGRTVRWRSSAASVAAVDAATGSVTTTMPGAAVITAEVDGRRDSIRIVVARRESAAAAERISVAKPAPLRMGDSVQLRATVVAGAESGPAGDGVRWSSSDTTVVQVDPRRGVVRARSEGAAVITAQLRAARGTVVVTARAPDTGVASREPAVVYLPAPRTLRVGQREELAATVADARDEVLDGQAVRWTSADTGVVQVDGENGVVTGVGAGSTTVSARAGRAHGRVEITVVAADASAGAPGAGQDTIAAAEPAAPPAGDPPAEVLAPMRAAVDAATLQLLGTEYKTTSDTLRAVSRRLQAAAATYPGSTAIARLRSVVAGLWRQNQQNCMRAGQAATERGEAGPVCQ